jgi:hypothetical protein
MKETSLEEGREIKNFIFIMKWELNMCTEWKIKLIKVMMHSIWVFVCVCLWKKNCTEDLLLWWSL